MIIRLDQQGLFARKEMTVFLEERGISVYCDRDEPFLHQKKRRLGYLYTYRGDASAPLSGAIHPVHVGVRAITTTGGRK